MLLLTILPFIFMLSFVCSNYSGFDESVIFNSDSNLESCEADKNSDLESDCFCYDQPANDFAYKICKEPNLGTIDNLKLIYRSLVHKVVQGLPH